MGNLSYSFRNVLWKYSVRLSFQKSNVVFHRFSALVFFIPCFHKIPSGHLPFNWIFCLYPQLKEAIRNYPKHNPPGVVEVLFCRPSCYLVMYQGFCVVTFLFQSFNIMCVSPVIPPVIYATQHFPSGYSCFLDVDFCLITQTVHHSVNF